MKKVLLLVATLLLSNVAYAHTTSIGYVPGVDPGSVTFWTGSYHNSGGNEGALTLTGISTIFGPITTAFDLGPVSSKPSGLIDGINNFFWSGYSGGSPSLLVDPLLSGGIDIWQGVTFTGLLPGTYDFNCITCGTSVVWVRGGNAGVGGTVTLTAQDISSVPEPATLALMGLGLAGFGFKRRKQSSPDMAALPC